MAWIRSFWDDLSTARRVLLLVGVLLIVGIACAFGWWSTRTSYGVLFSGLRPVDAAEIATSLDTMQVPHHFAEGGATLLVPDDLVYDTRMKLVAQGVPHGGSVGFEVFKDSDFGVTEFAQRVNYQRALQGELERTISALPVVQATRVHLTLRRASMFEGRDEPSKASVSLDLKPGSQLTPAQVAGIERLVASAVEGLSPDAVTVLGPGGAVLSGNGNSMADRTDEQARIEDRLRQRIDAVLRQALGASTGWTSTVDVQLNYDKIKQLRDKLVPQGKDGNGLLTRQKTVNSHATPTADADGSHPVTGSGEQELEYAHGHEQEEVDVAPGRIARISVGILVPARTAPATMSSLEKIIGDAAGLDSTRGDRLDIAAAGAPAIAAVPVATPRMMPVASSPVRQPIGSIPSMPWWVWASGAGVFLLTGMGAGVAIVGRRQPARLALQERERLLVEIQHWIETPEQVR
ncbi:flagellar basal-body MS-ring/collar protein FliF [Pinirhizobacter sp.]|jgi:flagellar M-ring protein FliF|uniref:flagellar basal-body MS-ring/collar protein FliF n=1 Tax=Pinirhizobacter sp. TaxID=2950432 RepID=UPI002F40B7A9